MTWLERKAERVQRHRIMRRLRARSGLRPPRKLAAVDHEPRHARNDSNSREHSGEPDT